MGFGPSMVEDRNELSDYTSEDEGAEDYRQGGYHFVQVGDSSKNGCYAVQTKLNWGHFSMVRLAWDTQRSVCEKLCLVCQKMTEKESIFVFLKCG